LQLHKLCEKYKVKELYLFGSANTDKISESSDLDFIVDFNRQCTDGTFDQFIDSKRELGQINGLPFDLYHHKNFRNFIFQQEVERSKKNLYAA